MWYLHSHFVWFGVSYSDARRPFSMSIERFTRRSPPLIDGAITFCCPLAMALGNNDGHDTKMPRRRGYWAISSS
jgi:hypothetical protein